MKQFGSPLVSEACGPRDGKSSVRVLQCPTLFTYQTGRGGSVFSGSDESGSSVDRARGHVCKVHATPPLTHAVVVYFT